MDVATSVGIADIEAARATTAGVAKHAGPDVTEPVRGHGSRDRAQGREPAAHGRVQDPQGVNKVASLGAAPANGVTAGGAGNHAKALPSPPATGCAVRDLRPRGRTDHEDRGVPGVRRPRRRARPLARGDDGAAREEAAAHGYGVLPSLRRPGGGRPARARSASSCWKTFLRWRASSSRSGAVGWRRGWRSPSSHGCRTCESSASGRTLRSLRRDEPSTGPVLTLADGIAVKRPGQLTGPLVERWIDDVVTVDEDAIADAMVFLMDRAKLYVEGPGPSVSPPCTRDSSSCPAREPRASCCPAATSTSAWCLV